MNYAEIVRYIVNGVAATLVHFSVLTLNIEYFGIESAGLSNFFAAFFGIASSYLGSRYYVFQGQEAAIIEQASKFIVLYGLIAIVHGLILLIWTDFWGHSYRIGFLIATIFQVSTSYVGNKFLVFKK